MPVRDTFGLVPPGSELALYFLFVPFGAVLVIGLRRRFAESGLGRAIAAAPGGTAGGLGRLLRYALLQRRVAHRPRGWPHLGIFFGFLTLLFGTTIVALDWDVARPLGVRLLAGSPYLWLEALLDALGLVFVAGLIAGLTWRLARLRTAGSDQHRVQRQFLWLLGGLLFMGLTGFILEGLRLTIRPVPWADWSFAGARVADAFAAAGIGPAAQPYYVALWWTHALVAFTVIASLPYTVFLHAAAAPFNVMAQAGRPRKELPAPFDLREIEKTGNFDVKVGASGVRDLDQEMRFALQACTNCGRCDDVCPAVATGTALSPRRLVQTLRAEALRHDPAADLLAAGTVTADVLWACTTCAACVEACPVFIRPVDYIVPFRRELVARQQVDRRQGEFLANLGRSMNPYGLSAERRNDLATELRRRGSGSG